MAIVGSRAALLPIYGAAGVHEVTISGTTTPLGIPSILEEWKRTGRVSTYKGVALVELPQIFKQTKGALETKLIPDTSVLVMGDNAGEAILYGDSEFQESYNLNIEPADYTMAVWRQFGMIVDRPERMCVIRVAESTPAYKIA